MADITGSLDYRGQGNRLDTLSDRVITDLTDEALRQFLPGRVAQMNFLELYQPEKATIGIGGNDAGFVEKIQTCILPGTCHWALPENREQTAQEIQSLSRQFLALYAELVKTAPMTKVYAVGYPEFINDSNNCDQGLGLLLGREERVYIWQTVRYLNTVIKRAATSIGIPFVDIGASFGQHALCGPSHQKAMNGIRLGDDVGIFQMFPNITLFGSESFHPTAYGHELMAKAIKNGMEGEETICLPSCVVTEQLPSFDPYWNISSTPTRAVLSKIINEPEIERGSAIHITLESTLFNSSERLEVVLQPGGVSLGTIVVREDGSISDSVSLPVNVQGYHLLQLVGKTYEGEEIAMYQGINILSSKISQKNTLKTEAYHILPKEIPRQNADLKVEGDNPVGSTLTKQVKSELHQHSLIIVGVASMVGIIVICLIFVRLLKK